MTNDDLMRDLAVIYPDTDDRVKELRAKLSVAAGREGTFWLVGNTNRYLSFSSAPESDAYIAKVDQLSEAKEKDIMTV